ncbi:MAG: DnaJ domain-containing protein [Coxiellaceae bacterium]|nr:DnaJ domain-containing protein [Coxiellaceae bacterium]
MRDDAEEGGYKFKPKDYDQMAYKIDLYRALGIPKDADSKRIKKAYHAKMRACKANGLEVKETNKDMAATLNTAKEILLDTERKKLYDEQSAHGHKPQPQAQQKKRKRKKTETERTSKRAKTTTTPPPPPPPPPQRKQTHIHRLQAIRTPNRGSRPAFTIPRLRVHTTYTIHITKPPRPAAAKKSDNATWIATVAQLALNQSTKQNKLFASKIIAAMKKHLASTATQPITHAQAMLLEDKPDIASETAQAATTTNQGKIKPTDKAGATSSINVEKEYRAFIKEHYATNDFYNNSKNPVRTETKTVDGDIKAEVLVLPFHNKEASHRFLDQFIDKHPNLKDEVHELNPKYAQHKNAQAAQPLSISDTPQVRPEERAAKRQRPHEQAKPGPTTLNAST